jgi:hypothetical protein
LPPGVHPTFFGRVCSDIEMSRADRPNIGYV